MSSRQQGHISRTRKRMPLFPVPHLSIRRRCGVDADHCLAGSSWHPPASLRIPTSNNLTSSHRWTFLEFLGCTEQKRYEGHENSQTPTGLPAVLTGLKCIYCHHAHLHLAFSPPRLDSHYSHQRIVSDAHSVYRSRILDLDAP